MPGTFNFGEVILQALQNQEQRELQKQQLIDEQNSRDKTYQLQQAQLANAKYQFDKEMRLKDQEMGLKNKEITDNAAWRETQKKIADDEDKFRYASLVDKYKIVKDRESIPAYARQFLETVPDVEKRYNKDLFSDELNNSYAIDKNLYAIALSEYQKGKYYNYLNERGNYNRGNSGGSNEGFVKGSHGQSTTPAQLYQDMVNALGNSDISWLNSLSTKLGQEDFWNNFTPETKTESIFTLAPAYMQESNKVIADTNAITENNQKWTNQKNANTSHLTGFLQNTISPLMNALDVLNNNKKKPADIGNIKDLEVQLSTMYPTIDALRSGFDNGYFNQDAKNEFYDALKFVKGLYSKNKSLLEAKAQEKLRLERTKQTKPD